MENESYCGVIQKHNDEVAELLQSEGSEAQLGTGVCISPETIARVEAYAPFYNAVAAYRDNGAHHTEKDHYLELIQVEEIALYRRLLIFFDDIQDAYVMMYPEDEYKPFENSVNTSISLLTFRDLTKSVISLLIAAILPKCKHMSFDHSLNAIMSSPSLDKSTESAISRIAAAFALYEFGTNLFIDNEIVLKWAHTFAAFLREQVKSKGILEYQTIPAPCWVDTSVWQSKYRIFFKAYQIAHTQHIYP
jgi:hypothetical protein